MNNVIDMKCPKCSTVNKVTLIGGGEEATCWSCGQKWAVTNTPHGEVKRIENFVEKGLGVTHIFRDPLLVERQKTHGDFCTNAAISREIKNIVKCYATDRGFELCDAHLEALDMIALKLSRILSGQAHFKDHWDDIAGYAKLASEACQSQS